VFSGAMAQFASRLLPQVPMLVDFVDVDSSKWAQYAPAHRWPLSMAVPSRGRPFAGVRARGGRGRRIAVVFCDAERDGLVPVAGARGGQGPRSIDGQWGGLPSSSVRRTVRQRVDRSRRARCRWCSPGRWTTGRISTGCAGSSSRCCRALVATAGRQLRFYIVGRNPTPQVKALAGPMWWSRARCPMCAATCSTPAPVVAPLRVARGIQNKILEAMAMEQPVVTVLQLRGRHWCNGFPVRCCACRHGARVRAGARLELLLSPETDGRTGARCPAVRVASISAGRRT
jgi:hypothetical protein